MKVSLRVVLLQSLAALLILGAAICAAAQNPLAVKKNAREQTPVKQNAREPATTPTSSPEATPTGATKTADAVRYAYEYRQKPDFYVTHILIEHDATGRGQLTFERKNGNEPIVEPVELSDAARARITGLWNALGFLDSDKNYQTDRQYPQLGSVSLRMAQGTRERVAEFNWTDDANAKALADEYRRVADQFMFVFDITVSRENQPLEAPKLLDQLDILLTRNGLSDPHQLTTLLRDLTTDERLPLIARHHAERLLKKIEK